MIWAGHLFQKSVGIDLGAEFFGEGFVGGIEGFKVDGDGVSGVILGLESHANLIPADIGPSRSFFYKKSVASNELT